MSSEDKTDPGIVKKTLDLVDEIHGGATKEYAKADEGEMSTEAMIEANLDIIAAAAHMANRAYCIAHNDHSQATWEEAPDWQKDSVRNGVRAKLRDPSITPAESHLLWLGQKTREGWKYGSVKDPEKKLHPCFLPYEQLPPEHRFKDELFLTNVMSMAKVLRVLGTL